MTERKPPGVDWQTWIDRQIEEGRAQGHFDGLAGHGKPIRGIERPRDELWWVREKLQREGVEYLPPSLAIRKKAADAKQRAMEASSEGVARVIIDEINQEIRALNRLSIDGPPTTLMPFDVEEILETWRRRPRAAEPSGDAAVITKSIPARTDQPTARRLLGRWFARITRRGHPSGRRRRSSS